ncbi:hypothetical protein GCM10018987_11100 [Streptomyces cremeus]
MTSSQRFPRTAGPQDADALTSLRGLLPRQDGPPAPSSDGSAAPPDGAPVFTDLLEDFLQELNAMQADFYHRAVCTSSCAPGVPRPARTGGPKADAQVLPLSAARTAATAWEHSHCG